MKTLLLIGLFCILVYCVSGQGNKRRWGKRRQEQYKGERDWSDVTKASWNTSLSDGSTANERGFVSNNNKVGFLMSKDRSLTGAGYDQSFSMIDFGTGKQAIRVEVSEPGITSETLEKNKRNREFWAKKKHLCFILDAPTSLFDFSQELELRSSISWAGPIPTGNLKTFVAKQSNKVTDLGSNGIIDRFCRTAMTRGMAFSIVADSSVTERMDRFVVMGQADPLQPLTSVPYEIKVESGILV